MSEEIKLDTSHEIEPPQEKLLEKPKPRLNWKMFIIAFIVVIFIEVLSFRFLNTEEDAKFLQSIMPSSYTKEKSQCEINKGHWLEEFKECENIDKKVCDSMKGQYNNCASTCRHNKSTGKGTVCTQMCWPVCSF